MSFLSQEQYNNQTLSGIISVSDGQITIENGTINNLTNLTLNGNLDMSNNGYIENLLDPINLQDGATKNYVDNKVVSNNTYVDAQIANTTNYINTQNALKLNLNGSNTMTSALYMGNNRIIGVSDPTGPQNASTKNYTDVNDALRLKLDGSTTMTGSLYMGGFKIANLADPVSSQHASTKYYTDNADNLRVLKSGDTMSGNLNMGGNWIQGSNTTTPPTGDTLISLAFSQSQINAAIGNYLPLSGGNIVGTINMNNNALINISTPLTSNDAVNKSYVDSQDLLKLNLSGGTISGTINMNSNKITNLPTPLTSNDAVNKLYVDSQDSLKLNLSGGTMSGNLNLGGNWIQGSNTTTPPTGDTLVSLAFSQSQINTAISNYLALSGGTMSGTINMNSNKIINLSTPTSSNDGVNKSYVDNQISSTYTYIDNRDALKLSLSGGTLSGNLTLGGNLYVGSNTVFVSNLYRTGYNQTEHIRTFFHGNWDGNNLTNTVFPKNVAANFSASSTQLFSLLNMSKNSKSIIEVEFNIIIQSSQGGYGNDYFRICPFYTSSNFGTTGGEPLPFVLNSAQYYRPLNCKGSFIIPPTYLGPIDIIVCVDTTTTDDQITFTNSGFYYKVQEIQGPTLLSVA
jgi:hypothetical protein